MIIPIRSASVMMRPFASSVAYHFFIAIPDTNVPKAFKIQKIGIDTILIIIGPTTGIAATKMPIPAKISVNTPTINAVKTISFLSIP